jgi:hypothetical protein
MKIPLAIGNLAEIIGTIFALYLIYAAADISQITLRFLFYLISWGSLVFFPHCLVHFIVGRLVGIRFTNYSFGRSAIGRLRIPLVSVLASKAPVLTLKVHHESLKSASRGARAVMFASGAVTSMVLPFFAAVASLGHLPLSLTVLLMVFTAANLAFDIYYSPRAGDISRIRILQ